MFSWSKKKDSKRKGRPDRESEENEFGIKLDKGPDDKQLEAELKRLAGVDSLPEDDINLNEGEEDVESELLRLIGGGGKGKKPKKAVSPEEPLGDISKLTAEIDLGDEDVEVDENDPELLGELLELTNPEDGEDAEEKEAESDSEPEVNPSSGDSDILTTLKERLKMYKTAEEKAKENKESSRARRFARGIKTIEDLLKKAKAGKSVSPDDIPPVIALNLKPVPLQPEVPVDANEVPQQVPEQPEVQLNSSKKLPDSNPSSETEDIKSVLLERLKLYQTAEAKAKEAGETTRARRFGRGIKTLQGLIKQAQAGNPIAPEDIPPIVALNLKPPPPIPVQPLENESAFNSNEEGVENEMGNINLTSALNDTELNESGQPERNMGVLSPTSPVVVNNDDNKHSESGIERENLVQSSDTLQKPLSFSAVDDVDIDEELAEEEIPKTVLEGLEQRVRFYSRFREEAKVEGNLFLADQNERIVQVYLNAIKTYKKGGYVDVEKLPNPKRCPPIPIPFFIP